jgi:hypothetical protein
MVKLYWGKFANIGQFVQPTPDGCDWSSDAGNMPGELMEALPVDTA